MLTKCSLCTLTFNSGWISKDSLLCFPDVLFSVLHCRGLQGKEKSCLWLKLPDTHTCLLLSLFCINILYLENTGNDSRTSACKYEESARYGGKFNGELVQIWPSCDEMLRSYSCQVGRESFMLAVWLPFKGTFQSAPWPAGFHQPLEVHGTVQVIVVMAMPLFYLSTLFMMEVNWIVSINHWKGLKRKN